MEQMNALRQTESTLSLINGKISAIAAKLEDLVFRAQRIATAKKTNQVCPDTMFGYDLQNFRGEIRRFGQEVEGLPNTIGTIERSAVPNEDSVKHAQTILRLVTHLSQALRNLHDQALITHQAIRESDFKIQAWYLVQEIEQLAQRGQSLPTAANRVVLAVAPPEPGVGK